MNNEEIKSALTRLNIQKFRPVDDFPERLNFSDPLLKSDIEYTEKLGLYLCDYLLNKFEDYKMGNPLTNSQIRNFFGEVKRIQMRLSGKDSEKAWEANKSSFHLLKPKLAYAAGRAASKNDKSRVIVLTKVLTIAIDRVKADEKEAHLRFLRFVDFFEAIIAYHKSFGGKE